MLRTFFRIDLGAAGVEKRYRGSTWRVDFKRMRQARVLRVQKVQDESL